jgi:hypothetical protein
MKIGVYFNRNTVNRIKSGAELSELRYLIQEAIPEGIEILVFSPDGISWWNKEINGLRYDIEKKQWVPGVFGFPDALYDRATFPEIEKKIGHEARKRLKEEYNIVFLNNKGYFNKWATHKTLILCPDLTSYLPSTEIYNSPSLLEEFLNRYRTVYVKDSAGKLGHNIFKVQKHYSGKYIVYTQENSKISHSILKLDSLYDRIANGKLKGKTIIIQQGIELARLQNKPFDIRILVQKNGYGKWQVVDKSIRVAASKNSVVTNISAGGEAKRLEEVIPMVFPGLEGVIEKQLNIMSLNICGCLERKYGRLGELGIDAALDEQGRVWLLEVNGKPAKSCVHNSNNPELIHIAYSNIVKYFKYILSNNTQSKNI